ncbi:hypothetical protein [Oscillibacter sp. MSJ-31]|uniref:hypothetical protein n=1 Tax=Oscillibacter sp. MSJ-31 TaxID=2841526 RepID=UPI001C0F7177|nr:hypothetical protein [Oscillibacter sp. MSJ-31]MBU5458521.1 hypothetical protein [Oscillibacter sp. MSJ-31]
MRGVFLTRMSPEKTILIWFRACGREMQGVDTRERGKNDFIWFRACGRERGGRARASSATDFDLFRAVRGAK